MQSFFVVNIVIFFGAISVYCRMDNHDLILKGQKKLLITGIKNVDGMSDKQIDVQLVDTKIVIKGDELSVTKLDAENGNLEITAKYVSSLVYIPKNKVGSGISKLFK